MQAASSSDSRLRGLILIGLALALGAIGAAGALALMRHQPLGIDFLPMWTGARLAFSDPGRLYNFYEVTRLQDWLLHDQFGPRPFVYPPTALLVFAPFRALPFFAAYAVWTGLGAVLMLWASVRQAAASRRSLAVLLLIAAGPCVTAALVGQASFLVAGLVVFGLSQVRSRPVLAGVLFGLAACIKPTALVLAPFALVAGGHYRALILSGVTGVALCLASLLVFGPDPWREWLHALPRFQMIVEANPTLIRGAITPTGMAVDLRLEGAPLLAVRVISALIGLAIAWLVFWRSETLHVRLIALLGGGLLATPYAMHYEATLLAPGVVLALLAWLEDRRWVFGLIAYLALTASGFAHQGAIWLTLLVLIVTGPTLIGRKELVVA